MHSFLRYQSNSFLMHARAALMAAATIGPRGRSANFEGPASEKNHNISVRPSNSFSASSHSEVKKVLLLLMDSVGENEDNQAPNW